MAITPVILAGGFGMRLWPISRRRNPKQFACLIGEETLFQQTLIRLKGLSELSPPIVVCNKNHYDLVANQLQSIRINEAQIILEPVGKNTAPAVAIAAFKELIQGLDPLLLVLPADHVIANVPKFHRAITIAKKCAEQNFLVCFGIIPNRPETGYGYIMLGEQLGIGNSDAYKVLKFIEKPNLELAKQYISSGKYYWNSGMFMFRASVYLQELKKSVPDIYQICENIVSNSVKPSNNVFEIDMERFNDCRSDSIDYAIMEKTKNTIAIPIDVGWSDLGSWQALWECAKKDHAGNVIIGDVNTKNVNDSYIHATGRKIVVLGVTDCVIIETANTILVVSKKDCQDIKLVIDSLAKEYL